MNKLIGVALLALFFGCVIGMLVAMDGWLKAMAVLSLSVLLTAVAVAGIYFLLK